MKTVILLFAFLATSAWADEFIQYSNGATAWRNNQGFIYGYSGGVRTGDSGFNDTRTGERYEYTGPNNAINTRNGQSLSTPRFDRGYQQQEEEYNQDSDFDEQ